MQIRIQCCRDMLVAVELRSGKTCWSAGVLGHCSNITCFLCERLSCCQSQESPLLVASYPGRLSRRQPDITQSVAPSIAGLQCKEFGALEVCSGSLFEMFSMFSINVVDCEEYCPRGRPGLLRVKKSKFSEQRRDAYIAWLQR